MHEVPQVLVRTRYLLEALLLPWYVLESLKNIDVRLTQKIYLVAYQQELE